MRGRRVRPHARPARRALSAPLDSESGLADGAAERTRPFHARSQGERRPNYPGARHALAPRESCAFAGVEDRPLRGATRAGRARALIWGSLWADVRVRVRWRYASPHA